MTTLYREEVALNHLMMRATQRGIMLDLERRDSTVLDKDGKPLGLAPQLRLQRDKALVELQAIGGGAVNPRKPAHIKYLLFDMLGFPIVKVSAKSGKPAVDKEAMMLLELLADTDVKKRALHCIVSHRQAEKFLSTFVDGLPILADQRLHPSWKILTTSGRMNSSPNAQNWSKRVKRLFRAPPGFKLVGIDLSQAELRYIAFLANDVELLRMYREEINVHTVNASLLFGVRCPVPKDTNPQTEAYLTEMYPRLIGKDYASLPLLPKGQWKFVRTLGKLFVFAGNYGALAETIHGMLRSKRDPDTNELLFPDLRLDEIEALHVQWTRKLHPALPSWWDMTAFQIERAGRSKCPISGRVRWFRGGFKRNEMLNVRVQTAVASWMNQCTLEIQDVFDRETRGWAQINQQVHDALTVEAPDDYAKRAGEVMQSILSREIHVPGVGTTRLPADKADIGQFMDEV